MQKSTLSWVAGFIACAPMLAIAQPAEPTRPAAQLKYSSAFADYKPFQDLEPGNWRALNDAVGAAAAMPAHDMKSMSGMGHPMQGGKP